MAKKPLEIDMCAGSQLRDTQGEMLSVEGADVSELEAGKGRLNDNHGKGFFNSIGRITKAKKVFKEEDCDDDRQRYYWNKVKAPYLYVRGFLYDDEDHPNAKAAAAILRNVHKTDCPLKLKASVEGGVVSRGISDPSLLARTKIHSVALTFTPANVATLVEPLGIEKSQYDEATDMELIKSVIHLAQTNVPSFRHIARDASASKVVSNIEKLVELMKGDEEIDIPTKQEIIEYALEAKIERNISAIHDLIGEELDKGLKSAAMGAMMSGVAALSPNKVAAPAPAPGTAPMEQAGPPAPSNPNKTFVDGIKTKNPFLYALAMQESSGGKNVQHKMIKKGMHKGHNAGGPWGLMPNTAALVLKKNPELAKKYPDLTQKATDVDANHQYFTDTLNNKPEVAYDFATALLGNLKKLHGKNFDRISHAWYYGPKATRRALASGQNLDDDAYVKGVKGYLSKLKPKAHEPVKKGLTAGYGGSGMPTANTGGGVLQSEALDDGRGSKNKSFKYVSCDDCGKEQIYSKYQVKCRECGKSFPMEKLHKLFLGAIAT